MAKAMAADPHNLHGTNGSRCEAYADGRPHESAPERSVRIAIVISHPVQHYAPLYRSLAALPGVESKVFYCLNWGAKPYFDPDFAKEFKWDIPLLDGYASEFLPGTENVTRLGFRKVDNRSVTQALKAFQPDVVQVFGYAFRTLWRAASWCHRNGIPVLIHSDSDASWPEPLWKRIAKRIVVGTFYRWVDGAFFVGDNNYAYHLRYGVQRNRLFPGALPIDRERLTLSVGDPSQARREIRARHGIPEDAFVVVCSGKMYARKAPLHVLSAVERCSKVTTSIWALFVGDGIELPQMQQLVETHQMRNVVLAGFVNQSSIGKYYAASDVLVVASARDNHPLVLPEAGCFGLPAIVSDRLGCIGKSDTARAGENALVYPFADIDELANCILKLYSDKALYRSMSRAAISIANSQDVAVTARQLKDAAVQLSKMGCRQ